MSNNNATYEPARSGIVVGVDGSPASNCALSWAAAHTEQFGPIQPVLAWHYPWWMMSNPLTSAPLPPPKGQFQFEAEDEIRILLQEAGIREYETPIVAEGAPGPILVSLATSASLVVVGTRGRGPAADTLLGSVSNHVVSHASVPVVVVPKQPTDQLSGSRVVVGIDGSANSTAALVWALQTTAPDTEVCVVHTWQYALTTIPEAKPIPSEMFEEQAQSTLDRTIAQATELVPGPHSLTTCLRYGDPRNILREESIGAKHLVVGSQGHHGVAHILLGSTTSGLIHQPMTITVVVPST